MKKILLLLLLMYSVCVNAQNKNIISQAEYDTKMSWWREARFGMFIHWGIYSQLAGEWKGKDGYDEFIMLRARIPIKEYEQVARTFCPSRYDADKWVLAAKNAGMKYIVYTSKHHEGFSMYRSGCSRYNIFDFTPFHRDPLQELADACRKYGMKLGIYYSLGRDWHDPDVPTNWPAKGGRSNTWDFPNEDAKDIVKYYNRKVRPQIIELMNMYQPDILWFDTPDLIPVEQSRELRQLILSIRPDCIINDRIGNKKGDYQTVEQKTVNEIIPGDWEACVTVSRNWGYMKADTTMKSPEKLVGLLVDMASKGGNLLLNVGPDAQGVIRETNLECLSTIGGWMKTNGEAIYGTTSWDVYGEDNDQKSYQVPDEFAGKEIDAVYDGTPKDLVQDIRFTRKGQTLYVIARSWRDKEVLVEILQKAKYPVETLSLLGYGNQVEWKQDKKGLKIVLPESIKQNNVIPVYVFKVELSNNK